MTIEILKTDNSVETREHITFEEIQKVVGGYVELVTVEENGKEVQCCCNEDGRMLRLPYNVRATVRFRGKINNAEGAVGDWVILSGKDLLE